MVTRKRTRAQAEDASEPPFIAPNDAPPPSEEGQGLLSRIRNMWEFAALVQYIYSFGSYMKIPDEYDIDLLETECLKPGYSPKLLDLGLTLLKFVSSHRGLTHANFDEYTRRQYLAKAPSRNPFGDDAEPLKFNELDVVTKIRVLHQLTMWTSWNPDRFRAQMPEQKENQQISWRIEEFGYDSEDRYYYVLDDNRLYRRTNPPISASQPRKPKANSKRGRALARAAKKRKLEEAPNDVEPADGETTADQGYRWECLAITLDQYQAFVDSLQGSNDPDEQVLRDRLIEHVFPIIEKQEEAHQRKLKQRERELSNMERLAHAKRSSRIAMKQEQERLKMEMEEERRAQEAEHQKQIKQEELQRKLEREHQQRLLTREKRLREREVRRREREEEIARVTEEAKQLELGEKRMSERRLKTEIDKRKKALEELKGEENWIFDCSGCGVYGENHDDGTHTISCEKCNVWQHSACLGISKDEAEDKNFRFICSDCKRRIEEANRPKIPPLRFRIGTSSSPPAEKPESKAPGPTSSPLAASKIENATVALPVLSKPDHVSPASHPQPPSNIYTGGSFPQRPSSGQVDAWNPQAMPVTGTAPYGRHLDFPKLPIPQVTSTTQPAPTKHYPVQSSPSAALNGEAVRRLSSSRASAGALPSPIHNAPSFSPTQGNHDVGPLAGFPASNLSNISTPVTPHGGAQGWHSNMPHPAPRFPSSAASRPSFSPQSRQLNDTTFHSSPLAHQNWTGHPTSSLPTANAQGYHIGSPSQPVQHSPNGVFLSGLSPTKHLPVNQQPSPATHNNHHILPPIRELKPSPKLMGRSSPDEPIPAPTKPVRPEQLGHASLNNQKYWPTVQNSYTAPNLSSPEANGLHSPADGAAAISAQPDLSAPKPDTGNAPSPSQIPQPQGSTQDSHG